MKWTNTAALLGLATSVSAQAESTPYTDPDTGITFQSYAASDGLSFRLALPEATDAGAYDAIVQIEGPATVGWIGWAWGGQMTYNPLTIIWPNGDDVVHSSRMAFGYSSPATYAGASYEVLPKGTGISSTGTLKFTALCHGCTVWEDFTGEPTVVDASQPAAFAYAFANKAVATPGDNSSRFGIHEGVGHWYHDLPGAKSPQFADWVAANLGAGGNSTVGAASRVLNGRRAAAGARPDASWRL